MTVLSRVAVQKRKLRKLKQQTVPDFVECESKSVCRLSTSICLIFDLIVKEETTNECK